MKAAKAIFLVIFLVIIIVLLMENYAALSQPFSLKADFLVVHWNIPEYPIGAYLLFSFLFGFLMATGIFIVSRIRKEVRGRDQGRRSRESAALPQESKDTEAVDEK